MTRATSIVVDGNTIKFRLEADRIASGSVVHVDWLRFTVPRRNVLPSVDNMFPRLDPNENIWTDQSISRRINALIRQVPDCEVAGSASIAFDTHARAVALEAFDLAERVSKALGPEFSVAVEVRKGHDFYKHRWSIQRQETECGWVGFLSSSTSPRQQAQNNTIHVNLYGHACTFALDGWRDRLADLIDDARADITRCDLALDYFDGIPGGFDSVVDDYRAGLCNVNGKEPKCNQIGDWIHGHSRSFYIGSKEAGKQTNVYEKGDQLFGVDHGSPWHRIELRYGNKLRVLPSDILRRPADFFAGASDWHQVMLLKAGTVAESQPITCKPALQVQTVSAEVARSLRWTVQTALASLSAWVHLGGDKFINEVVPELMPKRFQKFNRQELQDAMSMALDKISTHARPGPAFAV